jgi:hypothetical protein
MLNTVLKSILTLVFAWFLAVIVDRIMTKVTSTVMNAFRRQKAAEATK